MHAVLGPLQPLDGHQVGPFFERYSALACLNPSRGREQTLADLRAQVQAGVRIGEIQNIGQGILDRTSNQDSQLLF